MNKNGYGDPSKTRFLGSPCVILGKDKYTTIFRYDVQLQYS
jgi:hypothetical protein